MSDVSVSGDRTMVLLFYCNQKCSTAQLLQKQFQVMFISLGVYTTSPGPRQYRTSNNIPFCCSVLSQSVDKIGNKRVYLKSPNSIICCEFVVLLYKQLDYCAQGRWPQKMPIMVPKQYKIFHSIKKGEWLKLC